MRTWQDILATAIQRSRQRFQRPTRWTSTTLAAVIADAGADRPGSRCSTGNDAVSGDEYHIIDDEVMHGVPTARDITEGDLLSIDAGCILDGSRPTARCVRVHVGEAPWMEEVDLITACGLSMWARNARPAPVAGSAMPSAIQNSVLTSCVRPPRRSTLRLSKGCGGRGIETRCAWRPSSRTRASAARNTIRAGC